MTRTRKLGLALIALAFGLGLCLALPWGQILCARAIIALGPKGARMWAFRKVAGLGEAAESAVADIVLAADFLPLDASGNSLVVSKDDAAVLDWIKEHGRLSPELGEALILLAARRLESQHQNEERLALDRAAARLLKNELASVLTAVAVPGRALVQVLNSEDRHRRAAVLVTMVFKRRELDRGRVMEEPAAELRAALSRIAAQDSEPLNAGCALFLLHYDGFFETRPEAVERFIEAAAAALAGSLRDSDPGAIADFYHQTFAPPPEIRTWRETLRPRLQDPRRGVAIQAALLLSDMPVSDKRPIHRALLRAFEPEGLPAERMLALRALRQHRDAPADLAVPVILGAYSLAELRRIRQARAKDGALADALSSALRSYANRSPGVFKDLQESGDPELRAKAGLFVAPKGPAQEGR